MDSSVREAANQGAGNRRVPVEVRMSMSCTCLRRRDSAVAMHDGDVRLALRTGLLRLLG